MKTPASMCLFTIMERSFSLISTLSLFTVAFSTTFELKIFSCFLVLARLVIIRRPSLVLKLE